jgi:hypothetical protein
LASGTIVLDPSEDDRGLHRYDAHLVPDLIANIDPIVDGWIALNDRQAKVIS